MSDLALKAYCGGGWIAGLTSDGTGVCAGAGVKSFGVTAGAADWDGVISDDAAVSGVAGWEDGVISGDAVMPLFVTPFEGLAPGVAAAWLGVDAA